MSSSPEKAEIEDGEKKEGHEIMRLSIMAGVIATVLAGIALLFSGATTDGAQVISASSSIVIGVMFLLAISSFSYIMLTGLSYAYPSKNKKTIGLPRFLELIRQKTYNFAVWFYWVSFFMVIYLVIAKSAGMNYGQSITFLNGALSIILAYILTPLVFILVIIKTVKEERGSIKGGRK